MERYSSFSTKHPFLGSQDISYHINCHKHKKEFFNNLERLLTMKIFKHILYSFYIHCLVIFFLIKEHILVDERLAHVTLWIDLMHWCHMYAMSFWRVNNTARDTYDIDFTYACTWTYAHIQPVHKSAIRTYLLVLSCNYSIHTYLL